MTFRITENHHYRSISYFGNICIVYVNKPLCSCFLFLIDIRRTYPENIYFRDVQNSLLISLKNVLVAFAHHNKSVGYCQVCECFFIIQVKLIATKQLMWIMDTSPHLT